MFYPKWLVFRIVAINSLLVLATIAPNRGQAQGSKNLEPKTTIEESMKVFAQKIKDYLKAEDKVQLTHFVEQGDWNHGANLDKPILIALQKYLGDSEAKRGQESRFTISGKVFLDDKKPALIIRPELTDRKTRQPAADFSVSDLEVFDYCDLLKMKAPASFNLPTKDEDDRFFKPEDMKKKLRKVIAEEDDKKSDSKFIFEKDGLWVRPCKGSPFKVQILVGDSPEDVSPRKLTEQKGDIWIDIKKNEIYQVKVANDENDEVGVRLLLDGIDQFHFMKIRDEDGDPAYKYWIIGGKFDSPFTIKGWLKDNATLESFKVTDLPEGAISQIGGSRSLGDVGIISVMFHECANAKGARGKALSDGVTGFGPPVKQDTVKVERKFGTQPVAGIAIRYSQSSSSQNP